MRRAGDSNFGPSRFGVFAAKDFRVRNDQPPASKRSPVIPIFSDQVSPSQATGSKQWLFLLPVARFGGDNSDVTKPRRSL